MKQLLNARFAPLTLRIGFLEYPISLVGEAYLQWKRQHFRVVESFPVASNLQDALGQLVPLTMPPRRILFLATDSEWTAYFDNGSKGADPLPPISYLAQQLGCRGLIATYIPHTLETETGRGRGTYGAIQFELFAPTQREFLNYERSISVAFEGGKWRFDANGTVQAFEEVPQYSARRIIDRFTPEMLQGYCNALGVRLFDDTFYAGPGLLIIIRDPPPSGSREITLEEARQQMAFA